MMWSNAHQSDQDTTQAVRVPPRHSMLSWQHVPIRGRGLGRASSRLNELEVRNGQFGSGMANYILGTQRAADKKKTGS